jgi:allantoin racemase
MFLPATRQSRTAVTTAPCFYRNPAPTGTPAAVIAFDGIPIAYNPSGQCMQTGDAAFMRLLLVNPNMTQAVTDRVVAEARHCAGPDATLHGVTAGFGVAIVSTEAEAAIAAHAALDLLATHAGNCDGAVVAMSFDAGAMAARRLLPIPVLGITEAALHTACLLGRRFGMIVSGAVSVPMYLDLLDASGLRPRMAGMEVIELSGIDAYLDSAAIEAKLLEAANTLAARPEIEAIVICGAATAGAARRLQLHCPVPLIDGVAAATAQVIALVRLGLRPRPGLRALSAGRLPVGLGAGLTGLLSGIEPNSAQGQTHAPL